MTTAAELYEKRAHRNDPGSRINRRVTKRVC